MKFYLVGNSLVGTCCTDKSEKALADVHIHISLYIKKCFNARWFDVRNVCPTLVSRRTGFVLAVKRDCKVLLWNSFTELQIKQLKEFTARNIYITPFPCVIYHSKSMCNLYLYIKFIIRKVYIVYIQKFNTIIK